MTLRPGWYAYRVTGAAELPSWAVEAALMIERPAASTMELAAVRSPGERPEAPGPAGPSRRVSTVERPLGPGSRASGSQPAMAGPRDPLAAELGSGAAAQAMLLLRAPGRLRWLGGIAEAIAEVEKVAGVRPAAPEGEFVEGVGGWPGPRLVMGPALPGLAPVTPAVARAHLRMAGSRGLPAPLRRRRPATGGVELAWRAGAGSVLTCDGPDGRSAQAVVALRGAGSVAAITPPPGGALVLRAWRTRRGWGLACGLVLGAAATLGLGREAGRVAAMARTDGWDAAVLSGSAAMHLARAGSPDMPAPEGAAHAATEAHVAALLEACLAAGDLDLPPASVPWTLAVTP